MPIDNTSMSGMHDSDERRLRWPDHVAVLIGGEVGGLVGLALVAFWLSPGHVQHFHLADLLTCFGIGAVTGYFPGIVADFASLHSLNAKVGFLAAAATATFICGFLALLAIASAGC